MYRAISPVPKNPIRAGRAPRPRLSQSAARAAAAAVRVARVMGRASQADG